MQAQASKVRIRKQTQKRTGGLWIAVVIVLLAAGGAAWYFLLGGQALVQKPVQAAGPDYHTTSVRRGNIVISAAGQGTLTPAQSVDLNFAVSGAITELDVKNGDMVKAGQVLARLGNSQALQAAVAANQVQLLQAQQALNSLQQNSSLALAQAYQTYIQAQQNFNTAQTKEQATAYARCSKAVTTKYAAQVQAAQDKLSKDTYGTDPYILHNSQYQTALANYNYCAGYTQDEKTTAQAALTTAKVTLQQSEDNYNTLKAASGIDPNTLALDQAKVQQAQTALTKAQDDLNGVTLTAPFDGRVIFLAAGQGAMVDTSKFITIADVSHLNVDISVDTTDLTKLVVGNSTELVFDALPDQTFTGKVIQVDPQLTTSGQVQVATGTVQLDADAVKALQNLPLGLNASATVIQKQAKNVLIVPVQALRDLGNQNYTVFVVGPKGNLLLTPVKVGIIDTTYAEIVSGLQAGQVVSTGSAITQ